MMLANLGVMFQFQGGGAARNEMQRLSDQWGKFNKDVDRHGKAATTSMGNSVGAWAARITAGVVAFRAARAAMDMVMAKSRVEITNEEANLRALGLDDAAIEVAEKAAEKLGRKIAGVTGPAYIKALYDTVSAFSDLKIGEQTLINDIALYTAKATRMTADEATKLFGSFWGAASESARSVGAQKFAESWSSAIYQAVKLFKTTGPELAAAAKHSLAMLYESGWTPEQMATWWGSLVSGGMSGEAAGNAMKQFAIKERKGFGELMAAAQQDAIDAEAISSRLSKKQKKELAELVAEQHGMKGAELFKKDPNQWLDQLAGAIERLKAKGVDYKDAMSKAFGEEPVNALLTLISKRKSMGDLTTVVGSKTFGDVRDVVEKEMSKGVGPASEILGQLWQGASRKLAKVFEPLAIGTIKWLGRRLMTISDWVEGKLPALHSSLAAFAKGFSDAFSAGMDGFPSLVGYVEKFWNLIEGGDIESLREWSAELGRMAGTDLAQLVRDVGAIASFLADAAALTAKLVGAFRDLVGGKILDPLVKGAAADEKPFWSFMKDVFTKNPFEPAIPHEEAARQRAAATATAGGPLDPSAVRPGSLVPVGRMREPIARPVGQPSRGFLSEVDEIARAIREKLDDIAVNINVRGEVDGREILKITQRGIKAEAARHGDGYGENALGYGVK